MKQFGFIGMGNMGSAMLSGCLSCFKAEDILFSRSNQEKGQALSEATGVTYAENNLTCALNSRILILAIKPQYYPQVLEEIRPALDPAKIVISLAPGYTIKDLKALLGEEIRILRAMPNTPAMVLEGMTGVCFSEDAYSEEEKNIIAQFFTSFGKVETVPEGLMEAVTAASGSSPAFVYMMIEALADGVVRAGMPRKQAYTFVAQAVLGAAKMVLETGEHPGELKDRVCSPAGTTIEAVAALERGGFRNCLIDAADAVCSKSRKIKSC